MLRSDTYSQIINTADIMFARTVKDAMAQRFMREIIARVGKVKGNDVTVDNYATYTGLTHDEAMNAFEKKELKDRKDDETKK